MKKSSVSLQVLKGAEIQPYINIIAELRLLIFREYPYLYEGNFQDERNYLKMYYQSEKSFVILALDGKKIIGTATGVSFDRTPPEFRKTFSKNKIPIEGIFYSGELILLKEYRNKGIGSRLYEELEKLIRGKYKKIAICELTKTKKDPKRPKDYVPSDIFWSKKGFIRYRQLTMYTPWKEIGGRKKIRHTLVFSLKDIK
ncbi:MAG: GNAT family N-acetyltransferase [Verrucomicrobia bacterium]|nr:GNAT family N-acetyltransferase [Verrucomicrobiota bacterium]